MNTPAPIEEIIYFFRLEDESAYLRIDEPACLEGEWWIDGTFLGQPLTLSWKQGRGFGIYGSGETYGDQPKSIECSPQEVLRQINKLRAAEQTSAFSSSAP